MDIEAKKLELIQWISALKDSRIINEIRTFKINVESAQKKERPFGAYKDAITYIAEDFNEPLDDFNEYYKENK